MDFCNDYFKILIIILLISVVFYLSKKIRENFITIGKCNVKKENCDKVPNAIKVMINTNNSKNKIKLTWKKHTNVLRYFILMYKNNLGPYIIYPKIDIDDEEYFYEMLNPESNVRYKFAVIGENNFGIGNVDNFTEAILTLEGLELKYVQGVNSKVICNADGSFKISDKCIENEEISANIVNDNKESDFNNYLHEELMNKLNSKKVLKFSF
jgi:hypothetical protein